MGFLRFILAAILLLVVGRFAVVNAVDWYEGQSRNPTAHAAGFIDYKEQDRAKAAGFSDPQTFRSAMALVEQTRRDSEAKAAEVAEVERARLAELNRNPIERMDIRTVSWTKDGFGTVGVVNLLVTNNNDFQVRDITVRCTFYGASGTELTNSKHTIYDIVKGRSKRTFQNVNVGFINNQAAKGACTLWSASRN